MVVEVGKALDKAIGVSSEKAFEILDKCAKDQSLCSFYIEELAKSPDIRNLATDVISKIESDVDLKISYDRKKGIKTTMNINANLDNLSSKDLQKITEEKL
jgi:hypothetical protein